MIITTTKRTAIDSDYIIKRLKNTLYKYPTLVLMKARLENLDEESKEHILISLKRQLYIESNIDIKLELAELVYPLPIA